MEKVRVIGLDVHADKMVGAEFKIGNLSSQGIPRIGRQQLYRQESLPKIVCDIAWKAQLRLTGRFPRLVARGKSKPKVATAIARELCGFIWAIAREVRPASA